MRITPLLNLLNFFTGARNYARVDPTPLQALDQHPSRHLFFHRTIVGCAIAGMSAGLVAGLIGAIVAYRFHAAANRPNDTFLIFVLPIMTAASGLLAGASWASLFAPREFLQGPLGSRWLKLVGTNNPLAARIVSLIVALLATGFCIAMLVLRDAKP